MQLRTNKSFKPLLKLLAGMLILAVCLVASGRLASAKGPESVTITGPGIDRPLELMNSDNHELITQLMEQSGLWYGTGDLPTPIGEPYGELGPAYTLTWVNVGPPGDSVEDRTYRQLLYLDAENGPLIHTPPQASLQNWGPGVIGWFAAPSGLQGTLIDLGVPITAANSLRAGLGSAGTTIDHWLEGLLSIRNSWLYGAVGIALLMAIGWMLFKKEVKNRSQ